MRKRANGGRVFIIFGEKAELIRRARAAEAYAKTDLYSCVNGTIRKPRPSTLSM